MGYERGGWQVVTYGGWCFTGVVQGWDEVRSGFRIGVSRHNGGKSTGVVTVEYGRGFGYWWCARGWEGTGGVYLLAFDAQECGCRGILRMRITI